MNPTAIQPKPSRFTKGFAICLVGVVLWSTTAIFIRYLTVNTGIPALVLAFWRDLFTAVLLALVFILARPRLLTLGRQHLGFEILYGLTLALFNSLWTVSVVLNGAAVSTVLAYSSAAFTALLGWWLFQESLGMRKVIAVVLSLTGCVFVSGAYDPGVWQLNPLGVVTGLLSGVGFAGYGLMGKVSARREINPWTTLMYTFGFAALFLLGFNLLGSGLPGGMASTDFFYLGSSLPDWLVLLCLVIPTIGGYGLYTVSLVYLPVSVANLIATLEPALTAIWAYLLLGERLTSPQIVGSLLIITGVLLLRVNSDEIVG